MQIEKALASDRLLFQQYPENFAFQLFLICSNLPMKFAIFLKSNLQFNSLCCLFCL